MIYLLIRVRRIGNRVLVKYAQPGTLMFKGYTNFDKGYWAGVALDKPEGDHDGTYRGVKYFVCAKDCGVFVRPDQISHLLEDSECKMPHFGCFSKLNNLGFES
uniref:CAP-Gly domain-containing protein n=1 Tax=Crocodylus porosus TaxID=8502 RepID=A0A7M4EQ30_CROPO